MSAIDDAVLRDLWNRSDFPSYFDVNAEWDSLDDRERNALRRFAQQVVETATKPDTKRGSHGL